MSKSVHRYNSHLAVQKRVISMKNELLPGRPSGGDSNDTAGYRSGVAARLAGLSAATLWVWERRYQLTATQRSATGQRLYTPGQVRRLGLLKQLVDRGHPIGTLAALAPERLLALCGAASPLAAGEEPSLSPSAATPVAAIGAGLVRRLAVAIEDGLPLRLVGQASSLTNAAQLGAHARAGDAAKVLLIELAEPDSLPLAQLTAQLGAARDGSGAGAAVLLYRFCSSATVRALRAQGFLVARFPAELGELPLLCRAALQRRAAVPRTRTGTATPARFDEAALSALAAGLQADGGVAVQLADGARRDSARALADVLLNMGSFERYSARCASEEGEPSALVDAALHRHLETVAGQARVLLEQAMERLLRQR